MYSPGKNKEGGSIYAAKGKPHPDWVNAGCWGRSMQSPACTSLHVQKPRQPLTSEATYTKSIMPQIVETLAGGKEFQQQVAVTLCLQLRKEAGKLL